MYIKLETEFITSELPDELTKDSEGNDRTLTDDELVQAGWYRFVVEPMPAVQFGERLTYTRTTTGAVCTQVWQVEPMPADVVAAMLAKAKISGHARIEAYARSQRVKIAGTSDDGEMAGWVNKLRIAQAIQAGTAAPHDVAAFQSEITARAIPGEDLPVFVGKVLRNAGFFGHASGLVDGIKRRAQDAVNAAATPAEVEQALTQAQASAEAAFAQLMAQVAA